MNNQSINTASPVPIRRKTKITPPGIKKPVLERILEIRVDVKTDWLAHPVQGVVTCWMEDFTLLLTTILNVADEIVEGWVIIWCDYLRQDVALQRCTVEEISNSPAMFGREH